MYVDSEVNSEFLNDPFTVEEVTIALNSQSAPGPDEIKAGYISNDACINFLCSLFTNTYSR